eukprot:SM000068S20585  [mRNA]  locus=s68:345639:347549:- [translate_table: standard]
MAAAAEALEVLVKAAVGEPERLGDCPFSQRVLLTLEEKHLLYEHKLVDTSNKPQWFLEANPEGKVPVIKHEGKWVADSDVIAEILDKMTPDPPLGVSTEEKSIGSALFGSFVKYLKSKDPSDGTREALEVELKKLEDQLTKSGGPFILGDRLSSLDLSLAPKLYHVEIALKHFKDWSMPPDLTALRSHIETVQARESFKKTQAPKEIVIRGWAAHDGVSK